MTELILQYFTPSLLFIFFFFNFMAFLILPLVPLFCDIEMPDLVWRLILNTSKITKIKNLELKLLKNSKCQKLKIFFVKYQHGSVFSGLKELRNTYKLKMLHLTLKTHILEKPLNYRQFIHVLISVTLSWPLDD